MSRLSGLLDWTFNTGYREKQKQQQIHDIMMEGNRNAPMEGLLPNTELTQQLPAGILNPSGGLTPEQYRRMAAIDPQWMSAYLNETNRRNEQNRPMTQVEQAQFDFNQQREAQRILESDRGYNLQRDQFGLSQNADRRAQEMHDAQMAAAAQIPGTPFQELFMSNPEKATDVFNNMSRAEQGLSTAMGVLQALESGQMSNADRRTAEPILRDALFNIMVAMEGGDNISRDRMREIEANAANATARAWGPIDRGYGSFNEGHLAYMIEEGNRWLETNQTMWHGRPFGVQPRDMRPFISQAGSQQSQGGMTPHSPQSGGGWMSRFGLGGSSPLEVEVTRGTYDE